MQGLHDQEQFAAAPHQLLLALAEQLKVPLLQIARQAELSRLKQRVPAGLADIESTADSAIRLIDGYLLGMQLSIGQMSLHLEPVSVASVLDEAAHNLEGFASRHQISLQLDLSGRYEPVMAHRQAFLTAVTCLGYVFVEAESQQEESSRMLTLAAHRTNHGGIAAGVFAGSGNLSAGMYRRARQLYGRARQPLHTVTASTGAGIFVADTIFSAMATNLRVAHHHRLSGLAASLQPSRQLNFV